MEADEDPIQRASDGSTDLHEVATWERRSALDAVSVGLYRVWWALVRLLVVAFAGLILVSQVALTVVAATDEPLVGALSALSVVPALLLVGYVWYVDPTIREGVGPMVVTFLLALVLAGIAALVNSLARPLFVGVPLVGVLLFFYLVVAPVEETVKLLAVRLWAYERPSFDAVIDGAVYGAIAGLGFATIENGLYIAQQYLAAAEAGTAVLERTAQTATVRSFAGPGHVIYSGFAGYYLGLAKFNPENAGPIVVKGLLIAALIHATYNSLVTVLPAVVDLTAPVFLGVVVLYTGFFGFLLYRKLARYRSAYRRSGAADERGPG